MKPMSEPTFRQATIHDADAVARIPNCRAKAAAFRGLHTRTSRNVRTRRIASR
jgi:hypothetical protein